MSAAPPSTRPTRAKRAQRESTSGRSRLHAARLSDPLGPRLQRSLMSVSWSSSLRASGGPEGVIPSRRSLALSVGSSTSPATPVKPSSVAGPGMPAPRSAMVLVP
eukprot:scaffold230624_cov32-Tisochrysis_lutea.AAC.2